MITLKDILVKTRDGFYKNLRLKALANLRPFFEDSPTIISNNCLAGFIYQDLNLPYLSPTAGLYFFFPDYIGFLRDINEVIYKNIYFVNESKYSLGNQRIASRKQYYPIGLLDNKYEIHFLHYKNNEEAYMSWSRRVERVDLENLVVLGTELDLCKDEDIMAFDNLSFNKKFFFTKKEHQLKSSIFVQNFERDESVGDPYRSGHLLYESLSKKILV